jgi:hypothetical protein
MSAGAALAELVERELGQDLPAERNELGGHELHDRGMDPIDQPVGESAAPPELELRFDAEHRAHAALVPDRYLLEPAPLEQRDDLLADTRESADVGLTQREVHPDGGDEAACPDIIHASDRANRCFTGA